MHSVLSLIKAIQEFTGECPCKKTVQKIVYLIQEAKINLGFDYSIHFYGPYSADLDSEIRYLCNCGDLNIDITGHGHMLSVNDINEIPSADMSTMDIITKFGRKSPSNLELLATALYIQREIPGADTRDIIDGVVQIKGSKYSERQIKAAIGELRDNHYFDIA